MNEDVRVEEEEPLQETKPFIQPFKPMKPSTSKSTKPTESKPFSFAKESEKLCGQYWFLYYLIAGGVFFLTLIIVLTNTADPTLPPSTPTNLPTIYPIPTSQPTHKSNPTYNPTVSPTTPNIQSFHTGLNTYRYDWNGDDLPAKSLIEGHLKSVLGPELRDLQIQTFTGNELRFKWSGRSKELPIEKINKALSISMGQIEAEEAEVYNFFQIEIPEFLFCLGNHCFEWKMMTTFLGLITLCFCGCCCLALRN